MYDVEATMQCSCGVFGISSASASAEVSGPNTCSPVPTPPETTSGTLQDRMGQLISRIQAGAVTFQAINLTITASSIANGTLSATVTWGLEDIERYNLIGLHVTNPQGSMLSWQNMKVAWCKYGAPNTANAGVLRNFMNDGT